MTRGVAYEQRAASSIAFRFIYFPKGVDFVHSAVWHVPKFRAMPFSLLHGKTSLVTTQHRRRISAGASMGKRTSTTLD